MGRIGLEMTTLHKSRGIFYFQQHQYASSAVNLCLVGLGFGSSRPVDLYLVEGWFIITNRIQPNPDLQGDETSSTINASKFFSNSGASKNVRLRGQNIMD